MSETKKLQRQLEKIENQIAELEQKRKNLKKEIALSEVDYEVGDFVKSRRTFSGGAWGDKYYVAKIFFIQGKLKTVAHRIKKNGEPHKNRIAYDLPARMFSKVN